MCELWRFWEMGFKDMLAFGGSLNSFISSLDLLV
jgi:hypothetical protein